MTSRSFLIDEQSRCCIFDNEADILYYEYVYVSASFSRGLKHQLNHLHVC